MTYGTLKGCCNNPQILTEFNERRTQALGYECLLCGMKAEASDTEKLSENWNRKVSFNGWDISPDVAKILKDRGFTS